MSRRFQIVLPDPAAEQLSDLAAGSREPPSTVAARLVREALARAASDGEVRALRAPLERGAGTEPVRPRWFEPLGGDRAWRREMWGAIVALRERYPRLLEALKDGWWSDEALTEMLCALVVWRAEIDDAAESPREELAFHRELGDFAQLLREQGGGVEKAWAPGAPPPAWLSA